MFVIETNGSYIQEVEFETFCDVVPDSLVFEGGYANPAEGNLLLYLQSTQAGGWNGSYLFVTVTGLDGTTETIVTSNGAFSQFNIPIVAGDNIEIEFILSNVTNPDFLTGTMYNCGNSAAFQTVFNDPVPGVLYNGPAGNGR